MKQKCVVLFSGGLDSRLAVKIMQEKGFEVIALFFKLPFNKDTEKEIIDFCRKEKCCLEIFDCCRGQLLNEYLEMIRNAKFGRGAGFNPCIDCHIFLLQKAREFADREKIKLVVTGEVLGERPMSQFKKSLMLVEEKSELSGRLFRPLSAKLLPKVGSLNKNEFYDIQGRRREKQIELAKTFGISYPDPGGGCLLCEPMLKKRLEFLVKRGMNEDEIKLINVGRHFVIDGVWIVLGRDEPENKIIESLSVKYNVIVPNSIGPSVVVFGQVDNKKVNDLIKAYSREGSSDKRREFEREKL